MLGSLAKIIALILPWLFKRSDAIRRKRISEEVKGKDEDATNARWDGWEKGLRSVLLTLVLFAPSGCWSPSGEVTDDPAERIRYVTLDGVDGVFVPLKRWERITLMVDTLYEKE